MSFLSLPAELRFQIYGIIAIPTTPFSAYRGMYLSCRQVKSELDEEGTKAVKAYVADIAAITPGIEIKITSGIPSVRLSLRLDATAYRAEPVVICDRVFSRIFGLHLSSLTISCHSRVQPRPTWGSEDCLVTLFKNNSHVIRAEHVVLKLGSYLEGVLLFYANLSESMLRDVFGWGIDRRTEDAELHTLVKCFRLDIVCVKKPGEATDPPFGRVGGFMASSDSQFF
jgi:hypothetical protein